LGKGSGYRRLVGTLCWACTLRFWIY